MIKIQSSYDYDDLIISGEESLFGDGNAQLPLPPMLMFDRITEINDDGGEYDKGLIRAELDVNPDLWFFECHFRNDPVMPGCLGLDAMWQLIGFFLGWGGSPGKGRALGVGEVKFTGTGHARCEKGRIYHQHETGHSPPLGAGHGRCGHVSRRQNYL